MGSAVTEKFGDREENIREARRRGIRKGGLGCLQSVLGKKKLLYQLEEYKRIEISDSLMLYVCSKEETVQEANETIL